jgi:hypothetical protein
VQDNSVKPDQVETRSLTTAIVVSAVGGGAAGTANALASAAIDKLKRPKK